MGACEYSCRFHLIVLTTLFYAVSYKNLHGQASAMRIHDTKDISRRANVSAASCRFGLLTQEGMCKCPNSGCMDFMYEPICMRRDSGRHWTFDNACYMIVHACEARKKRLSYWNGPCNYASTEKAKDVTGEYCEGEDVFYCENDGICKYNNIDQDGAGYNRRCLCKTGYYGPRCQLKHLQHSRRRRQTRNKLHAMFRRIQQRVRYHSKRSLRSTNFFSNSRVKDR